MGEYIQVDGHSYKLGTLESMYYCRYDDLREWIAAGRASFCPGNLDPGEYLGGKFRFRFPFPDEDGPEAERIEVYGAEYDRGVTVEVPAEFFAEVDHATIYKRISPRGVDYFGINLVLPCPLGPESDQPKPFPEPSACHLQIVQQRPFEGALWTVVRCAWCGSLWRLDPEWGRRLADRIAEHGQAVLNGYPRADASGDVRYPGYGRSLPESGRVPFSRGEKDASGAELARRIIAGYETVTGTKGE
jgi:hypothetical protein